MPIIPQFFAVRRRRSEHLVKDMCPCALSLWEAPGIYHGVYAYLGSYYVATSMHLSAGKQLLVVMNLALVRVRRNGVLLTSPPNRGCVPQLQLFSGGIYHHKSRTYQEGGHRAPAPSHVLQLRLSRLCIFLTRDRCPGPLHGVYYGICHVWADGLVCGELSYPHTYGRYPGQPCATKIDESGPSPIHFSKLHQGMWTCILLVPPTGHYSRRTEGPKHYIPLGYQITDTLVLSLLHQMYLSTSDVVQRCPWQAPVIQWSSLLDTQRDWCTPRLSVPEVSSGSSASDKSPCSLVIPMQRHFIRCFGAIQTVQAAYDSRRTFPMWIDCDPTAGRCCLYRGIYLRDLPVQEVAPHLLPAWHITGGRWLLSWGRMMRGLSIKRSAAFKKFDLSVRLLW